MCDFWYDYVKPKYGEKSKLCYMGTDSFIVYIKTDVIYNDIAEAAVIRFDTSNYELDRPLLKEKKKKVIGLMKDEECTKSKESVKKEENALTLKNAIMLLNERQKFLMLLKVEYFQKESKDKDLQVLQISYLART